MDKVKIGVFGAYRGMLLINSLLGQKDAEVVAICDKSEIMLGRCRRLIEENGMKTALYSDFDSFFAHDTDAVVLANYATEHAGYAEKFLASGRSVLSEVLPFETAAQAVSLVETAEKSRAVYAYAENYCYLPAVRLMKEKFDSGAVGELLHAEGEYVHNIASLWPQITYGDRNHWRNRMYSTFYCTHSLGPIIHITGRRPKTVVGFESQNGDFLADVGYGGGTLGTILCEMDNGATVKSLCGFPRHSGASIYWNFYGTCGAMESDRWRLAENIFSYTEGKSLEKFEGDLMGSPSVDYSANLLTTSNFVKAVRGESAETIGIYETCDMALPGILAYESVCGGHKPVKMPDMRKKEDRDLWRHDTFSTNPSVAGDMLAPLCSHGSPDIPDEVYTRAKKTADEILSKL